MKRILVPTAGEAPAKETAAYVVGIAKILDAELIALHVLAEGESAEAGDKALRIFSDLGDKLGVKVSGCPRSRQRGFADCRLRQREQHRPDRNGSKPRQGRFRMDQRRRDGTGKSAGCGNPAWT